MYKIFKKIDYETHDFVGRIVRLFFSFSVPIFAVVIDKKKNKVFCIRINRKYCVLYEVNMCVRVLYS